MIANSTANIKPIPTAFYIDLESDLLYKKNVSDKAKLLYAIINTFSKNKVGYCYLSYTQLSMMLGITKRRLYVYINQLTKIAYIEKVYTKSRVYLKPTKVLNNEMLQHRQIQQDDLINNYDWLNEE